MWNFYHINMMWYKLLSRKAFDMHKFESFRACINETKTKNSNYLYGHYYKKSWNSKLLCWGLDFIFFAQSLTQSIGLCVYAKSSNTRLAASSDAFCAYAVWFFFRCYGLPAGWLCVTDASCCTHSGTLNYVSLRLLNVNCHYLWVV